MPRRLIDPVEPARPVGPTRCEVEEFLDGTPALRWGPCPPHHEDLAGVMCNWCRDAGTVIQGSGSDILLVSLGVARVGDLLRGEVLLERREPISSAQA